MFHPYARVAGYFDEMLDGYRGPGNCIWSQEFYDTQTREGFGQGEAGKSDGDDKYRKWDRGFESGSLQR
jgi:hypothetical protein